jgi:hypothetical protein
MNWFLWFVVAWWVANAVYIVTQVGKPRERITAGTAAVVVLFEALFIAGMFLFGAHR